MNKVSNSIFETLESNARSYCRDLPAVFSRSQGHLLFDEDGADYIDFLTMAGTLNYGHNEPTITAALTEYIAQGGIVTSLDFHSEAKGRFLEVFQRDILAPRNMDYVVQFTGPTGTNAVEAAMKLAARVTGRGSFVSFTNSFHGMTSGSLSMTGSAFHRSYLVGAQAKVNRLPYCGYFDGLDSADLLARLVMDPSSGVEPPAAILLETIQGEGGINTATQAWLQKLADLAKEIGSLIIIDDIQSGCGRSGKFFSFEEFGLMPDLICLSKSISGFGLPMALLLIHRGLDLWEPGGHNGTFRGNNLAFVTATAAIEKYWATPNFEAGMQDTISQLSGLLRDIGCESGAELRGRGMMRGLSWNDPVKAQAVSEICSRNRLIVERCGPRNEVIKLLPPINIPAEALKDGIDRLQKSIRLAVN